MLRGKERQGERFSLPLHRAAKEGRLDDLQKLLIEAGGINQQDANGWTPLHVAVLHRQLEVARFLLFNHADIMDAAARNIAPASPAPRGTASSGVTFR